MTETFPAFDISPVPVPGPDAVAPEPFRGIYGMPMFVTVPTPDFAASIDFWCGALGFIDLFSVPGQLTHLRRWAFQDVLLVPGERAHETVPPTVSFSCVLGELEAVTAACEAAVPGCTSGPRLMPWGSRELEVRTPENLRVIMTAAQAHDPDSPAAGNLRAMGIEAP